MIRSLATRSVEKKPINSYKDLIVWQESFKLSILIYKTTQKFPKEEIYGLVSQMRRSAVSLPSNIAEGYTRHGKHEFRQFLQIAFASGAELETQILISKELNYIDNKMYEELNLVLVSIQKMLNSLIAKLKK